MKDMYYYRDGTTSNLYLGNIKTLHREDGPAVEYDDGHKEWWLNGRRHREDGPAIEYAAGYWDWWVNGERLSTSTLTKELLIKYMELNNLTIAHLLTDDDELVRKRASMFLKGAI
jgi:hypothetical protein